MRLKPRFEVSPLDAAPVFRSSLAAWFEQKARDYPWRRTSNAYAIWISEVMLQQTQIATVLGKGYYHRFLLAFPDIVALAAADDAPLLKAWEGLGYYRRARMMRETARAIVRDHAGTFPTDLDALLALPGIGRYTAGALRAFAFDLPAVVLDGNGIRVLARLMDFSEPVDSPSALKSLWHWAELLADDAHPRVHHAALMELGQTHCRPSAPNCLACPISRFCRATEPETLPNKSRKSSSTPLTEHAIWQRDAVGQILLHHEAGARRTGLWKLPLRDSETLVGLPLISETTYAITRYRVTLRVHDVCPPATQHPPQPGDQWISPDDWHTLAIAAPFRRVITALSEHH